MFVLYFNVPTTHVEIVKNAIFAAGAGIINNYSHGSWQTLGEGQFMPLAGSNAFLGKINEVEKVPEYKVETVCDEAHIEEVIAALKRAHPYEVPFYHFWKLENY